MRAAIVASVVVLFAAALQADGEYIYTFHTPGKIHVYLNRPENPRTVTFELRTFPADAFVLAGSVRADNPYRGLVTAGTYRLEAAEAMTVMVGERTDEACPSLFVQPRPGRGSGAYLYTGSPVCTTSGRAFLYSPQAGARFVFAGADLLDPVAVNLPALDHWMEVTDRIFHNVTYLRTEAASGMLQFFRGHGTSGYFVPAAADNFYVFWAAGLNRPDPFVDLPVRLHVVAGEDPADIVIHRWTSGRTLVELHRGTIAPGEEFTQDIVDGNLFQVRADVPVVVMVMPASDADTVKFMQFAHPLDQGGFPEGPSCGTEFKVPLRAGGRLRLFGGSGTTEVEIYDAANEYAGAVSFQNTCVVTETHVPAGWCLLRSRGERFAVQVETVDGGNSYVPRNIVADVIDRPLEVHDLRHSPLEPRPTDTDVYLSCITSQPATTVFHYRHIDEATWRTVDGSTTPSTSHWALVPMSGLIPGERYHYTVLAEDSTTGESAMPAERYFIVEEGTPHLVYVSSSLTQEDDRWILETTLRNDGTDAAFAVGWTCTLAGLIPLGHALDSRWDSMEVTSDDKFIYHVVFAEPVAMGASLTFRTTLRPYIRRQSWPRNVVVGDIDYQDRRGSPLVEPVTRTLYPDSSEVNDIFAATDYVILTCPTKLYDAFPTPSRVASLLMQAAAHAHTRNGGILAMANSWSDRGSIKSWVADRFSRALSEDWKARGYMLILGEVGVIPAFYWRASSHCWEDDGTLWRARNFDQYWADTRGDDYHRPELCLGRIIGDTTGEMQTALQTALSPSSLYKALVMSGTGNGARAHILPSALRFHTAVQWEVTYLQTQHQLDGVTDAQLCTWLRANDDGADVIGGFFHGNVDSWSPMDTGTILSTTDPIDFGTSHPVIFTPACLTGRYWTETMSLAEAFLMKGAAAYIGATSLSPLSTARGFTGSVGDYLTDDDTTLGRALRNGKRHWANNNDAWKEETKYTAFIMNYYGDPARPVLSGTKTGVAGARDGPEPRILGKGPLTVSIPRPAIEDHGDYDEVSLEGGGVLMEPERPLVPIHTEILLLPPGERVLDVKLDSRSLRSDGSGLRLPVPRFYFGESVPPDPTFSTYGDFWPASELREFEWKVSALRTDRGEIVDELLISIRPFHYHPRTQEWYFHQSYVFDVETISSAVTITEILASPAPSSLADEKLEVEVRGVNQSVNIDGRWTMRLMRTGGTLGASSTGTCTIDAGDFSLKLLLPFFANAAADRYKLQVALFEVRGAQTLLLHQDAIDHVHGLSDMVLEEIAVQPGDVCTDSNPTVRLVAQIRNRGEVTEAGEIHGEVWHVDTGKCLAVFSQDFEKVEPGGRIDFSADWRPGEMLEGSYRAVFRVDCEGGSAPVRVHEFAGCRPMELFVVPDADSYTQCQTAIVFARAVSGGETVETARYSARVTNPMGSAQFISLEAHPLEGAYFLLSFNPRYGDGVYEVRVSASADGYHTEAAYCSVVLSRNPAVLWPQRMHACADGKTVVTIDLGPVFTTHGWNPLINEYWDGRALHGFDPIFGDPWRDGPPLGWDRAVDGGVPLALVPDRTLATLTATAGEILNPDVNGKIPGIQIFLTGGRAEVLLQAPEDAGVAHVLAETEEAESLGFTRVEFTTADPNENEQRWCVGDIRRSALARGSVSPAGAYSDAFDLDADGAVSTQDVMAAAGSWGSSDPGVIHPPGASDLRRAAAIILRGDWEDAFAGQTFEIRIDVRAGEPLSGVDIVLDYDPEVIEPVDVQLGGWLSEGSGILTLGPILTTGRLRMGAVRRDRDDPGLTGEGTAVAIEARVLSAGPMGLALRGAIAAGPDGSDLPVILVSEDREAASGTGSLRGDANSDGSQDISDAIYILSCLFLGGPCPTSACAADSNNDGSRDISDAVFLLSFLFLGGPAPAPCP